MAQRRKDYAFERGDRVVFTLFGWTSLTRQPGVVTEVAPRGPAGAEWDYRVLLDNPKFRPTNDTGEALVLESELTKETP